jgi:hypothetical protein
MIVREFDDDQFSLPTNPGSSTVHDRHPMSPQVKTLEQDRDLSVISILVLEHCKIFQQGDDPNDGHDQLSNLLGAAVEGQAIYEPKYQDDDEERDQDADQHIHSGNPLMVEDAQTTLTTRDNVGGSGC